MKQLNVGNSNTMTAEVSQSDEGKLVLLDFEYECYALTPEEAERLGKELIKEAVISKEQ